jgi:hypothetical protein
MMNSSFLAVAMSAVAAVFSAAAAWMSWRINRWNQLEGVRADLIVEDWQEVTCGSPTEPAKILFTTIRNIGRGTAYDIGMGQRVEGSPCATLEPGPMGQQWGIAIIPPGGTANVHCLLREFRAIGEKEAHFALMLQFWDSARVATRTTYEIIIFKTPTVADCWERIGPNSYISWRQSRSATSTRMSWTRRRRMWKVKIRTPLSLFPKVPLLRC